MQQIKFVTRSFGVLTLMHTLQACFCQDENFWYSWCVLIACSKVPFCFTEVFLMQSTHGTKDIAPWLSEAWIGPFSVRSMLPIVRMRFETDLLLWSFRHLWIFLYKPR